MLTEEQLKDLVKDSIPSILEGLRKELSEETIRKAKHTASEVVTEEVKTFIQKEILPELHLRLLEEKEGLISLGSVVAEALVKEIFSTLQATVKKKFESSWERAKIFEALFK